MAWMTATEYKALTGVTLDDATVQAALDAGAAIMKRYIFIKHVYKSTTGTNKQIISRSSSNYNAIRIYVGDNNMDRVIDKNDINAYELDPDFVEYDLNSNISAFNHKYGVVTFDKKVPTTSDRVLFIEWYEAITDLELILPMMLEANKLEATNWMFQQIPYAKLQSGIRSWNLNGVTVDFDLDAIGKIVADNQARLKLIYNMLIPLYTKKTVLQSAPPRDGLRQFMTTLNWNSAN